MAFNVVHSPPYLDLALVGQAIGGGELAKEQEKFWLQKNQVQFQQEQALRDFSERQRQFNVNESMQQQRMAIEQDRYDQQFAAEDARAQALMYNQEANRQAQLMSQQMGYDQQAAMAGLQWEQAGADALDAQVKDFFKGARNMQLDPEGQRVLGEFVGKYRDIQANRGNMRPAQYQEVLGRLMGDMEEAGIDSFEIKQPTPWENMIETHTPMQGQIMPTEPGQPLQKGLYNVRTGTRNNEATYEIRYIPDPNDPFETDPVSGARGIRKPDGTWQDVTPPQVKDIEGERMKAEGDRKIKEQDLAHELFLKSIEMSMEALTIPESTDPVSGKKTPAKLPKMADVFANAREIRAQLEAELGAFSNPGSPGPAQGFVAQPSMEQSWYQGGHAMNQGQPQGAPAQAPEDFPEVSSPEEAVGRETFSYKGIRYRLNATTGKWDVVQ